MTAAAMDADDLARPLLAAALTAVGGLAVAEGPGDELGATDVYAGPAGVDPADPDWQWANDHLQLVCWPGVCVVACWNGPEKQTRWAGQLIVDGARLTPEMLVGNDACQQAAAATLGRLAAAFLSGDVCTADSVLGMTALPGF